MISELLLDLAYIALAVSVVFGTYRLGWTSGGLSHIVTSLPGGLAGGLCLLFGVGFFFLVLFAGAVPPMIIHVVTTYGWGPYGKHIDAFHVGPIGFLAQIVGVGTAGYLFFYATKLMIVLSLIGAFAINHYHL